jgi:hypothetical protein
MAKKVANPAPAQAPKAAPKAKAIKKAAKNPKALWDATKLAPGQQLSYLTYYRVVAIRGNDIMV